MISEKSLRAPSAIEQVILRSLLKEDFPGRDDLIEILSDFKVRKIDESGSFQIFAAGNCKARVVKQVPVEGCAVDHDGVEAHILLHVREGRPSELEIFKEDGSSLSSLDALSDMETMVLPPHPSQINAHD